MHRVQGTQSALSSARRWNCRDFIAATCLFAATAAVILWQNAHLVVLWDLSYVLDTASRIALGQVPYRDFPLAHAPLTFLVQATIIRLTGRVFFHHVLYAAIVGGLSTVLAWRIVLHIVRERVTAPWAISILLAVPLVVLGIYCILPHPSYDCDCAFSILVAFLLLQRLTPTESEACIRRPLAHFFLAGVAVAIPMFFKQNIGLPLLAVTCAAVALLIAAKLLRRRETQPAGEPDVRELLAILAGTIATLTAAGVLIHFTAGIGNYLHWTIGFAAQRRLPGIAAMLGVYRVPSLLWMLPCIATALALLSMNRKSTTCLATALFAAPFLWTLFTLYLYDDADERGDSLLALWPLLLILSAALTVWTLRRGLTLRALMPAILLVTITGTLMSQQLWGSTYAIWPLLMVLVAEMIAFLANIRESKVRSLAACSCTDTGCSVSRFWEMGQHRAQPQQHTCDHEPKHDRSNVYPAPIVATVIAVTLLICGGLYTASEERLSYAQFPDGPVLHATFPQLKGMSAPGDYLPEFEELLRFAAARIPASDGLVLIPGEDPFYFATGRVPQFPVLLFDPATQPYSPAELAKLTRTRNIRWLIVKHNLQIKEDPTPQRDATLNALLDRLQGSYGRFQASVGLPLPVGRVDSMKSVSGCSNPETGIAGFSLDTRLKGYDVYHRP